MSKLSKRREKRASQNKWILGEALTKRGRARKQARKSASAVEKKTGVKISPSTARQSGKISKKDLKGVEVTKKSGAFPKYAKKSKKAESFKSAFAKNCKGKGAGDSFSWDGRSYSCARASDKKKVAEAPKQKKKTKVAEAPKQKKKTNAKKSAKDHRTTTKKKTPENYFEKRQEKKREREKLYNRSKKLPSAEERIAARKKKQKKK